jgi:hypothetical protein
MVGGINWKAVWLEAPGNPVVLEPGAAKPYTVMGLNGADTKADLTQSGYLKLVSLNPEVVEVDRVHNRLLGKSVGETELRISFSEATSVVRVLVRRSALLAAAEPAEQVRKDIVEAYQRAMDAMRRGDADAAFEMETADWVSITVGQAPRTRQEMEPLIRRDFASMKPPPGWSAVWKPDYERNGTSSGIQIYDFKLEGSSAVVLYLIGSTRTETLDGASHNVWRGSHIRDTWTKTPTGWKRRMHEKLTVNERMVDGRPVKE